MDNLKMNRQLGTKWFTFYTKVRPWFACIAALSVVGDFMQYQEVYTSYWWMMVYFLTSLVQPVLCIIVFVKSQGDYEDFVRFANGVLLFETVNMAYGQAVQQYIQNEFDVGVALIIGVIILVLGYFIWYRLNMKYFKKRINVITNEYLHEDPNHITEFKEEPITDTDRIRFCRKCGEKVLDNSRFCRKCGAEVVEVLVEKVDE